MKGPHWLIVLFSFFQCRGSGMFIPDQESECFPSRITIFSIPDPYFFHPGSGSCFYPSGSRIQGSKRHRIRIRNTVFLLSANPDPWSSSSNFISAWSRFADIRVPGTPHIQCWGSGTAGSACFWASRILRFSHKGGERTEIMLKNKILTQNISKKLDF